MFDLVRSDVTTGTRGSAVPCELSKQSWIVFFPRISEMAVEKLRTLFFTEVVLSTLPNDIVL